MQKQIHKLLIPLLLTLVTSWKNVFVVCQAHEYWHLACTSSTGPLSLAAMELVFLIGALMMLCFRFVTKPVLVIHLFSLFEQPLHCVMVPPQPAAPFFFPPFFPPEGYSILHGDALSKKSRGKVGGGGGWFWLWRLSSQVTVMYAEAMFSRRWLGICLPMGNNE